MQRSSLLILAAAAVLALGAPAMAFHDGGVADCAGCHTMHNSEGGAAMAVDASGADLPVGTGNPELLLFPNKTDVCLGCHDGENGRYDIWSADPTAPHNAQANRGGGDFVFLEEDNLNDGHGGASSANWIGGHEAGHSVISNMKGTTEDTTFATSPGGSYDPANMHCTSCHDPHGTSAFRILYQQGQSVDNVTFAVTLQADGISLDGSAESPTNHNYYEANYSQWCATCHGDFHNAFGTNLIHPSGTVLTTEVVATYNQYRGTADCVAKPPTGAADPCGDGADTDSYLHLVPFEDSDTATYGTTTTQGPTGTSRVVCVSCHRAHATSAPNAGRWDFQLTGLAEDGHESGSYRIPQPYGGTQRSLCNKCHGQDEYDEARDFTP